MLNIGSLHGNTSVILKNMIDQARQFIFVSGKFYINVSNNKGFVLMR